MINTNKCCFNKQSIIAWYSARFEVIFMIYFDVFFSLLMYSLSQTKNSKFLLSVIPIFQSTLGKTNCYEKSGDLNIVKLQ